MEEADVRVLIVDDTPDMRLLLRVILSRYQGFSVVGEAGDGLAAIDEARAQQPDLVLLDLAMPRMDGLEALPLIKEAAPACDVIVLSGFEAERLAASALTAGASAYVQKGAAPEELMGALTAAIGRSMPEPKERSPRRLTKPAKVSNDDHNHKAIARAAHELRNPAIALTFLADELMSARQTMNPATMDRVLEAIVRQTSVIDQLTTDLLTSTHARRGSLVVRTRPVKLLPCLQAAALTFADQTGIEIHCPDDLVVSADTLRLQQMLTNLLSNSLRYGAPPIVVEASVAGRLVEVRVVDHGAGVPEWFRDELFDEYSQAEPDRGTGTGIGLFVVKSIAEAQGGQAWYEQRPDGAAFCVSMPLAPVPAA